MEPGQQNEGALSGREQWDCPCCTFYNERHINFCEMCQAENPMRMLRALGVSAPLPPPPYRTASPTPPSLTLEHIPLLSAHADPYCSAGPAPTGHAARSRENGARAAHSRSAAARHDQSVARCRLPDASEASHSGSSPSDAPPAYESATSAATSAAASACRSLSMPSLIPMVPLLPAVPLAPIVAAVWSSVNAYYAQCHPMFPHPLAQFGAAYPETGNSVDRAVGSSPRSIDSQPPKRRRPYLRCCMCRDVVPRYMFSNTQLRRRRERKCKACTGQLRRPRAAQRGRAADNVCAPGVDSVATDAVKCNSQNISSHCLRPERPSRANGSAALRESTPRRQPDVKRPEHLDVLPSIEAPQCFHVESDPANAPNSHDKATSSNATQARAVPTRPIAVQRVGVETIFDRGVSLDSPAQSKQHRHLMLPDSPAKAPAAPLAAPQLRPCPFPPRVRSPLALLPPKTDAAAVVSVPSLQTPPRSRDIHRRWHQPREFQREDFVLGKRIGRGGYADVMQAHHSPTGKKYAMKVLKYVSDKDLQIGAVESHAQVREEHKQAKEEARNNTIPEGNAEKQEDKYCDDEDDDGYWSLGVRKGDTGEETILGELRYPFVVELLAFWREEHQKLLLFELAPDGCLYSKIERCGALCPAQTMFYTAQLVLAVEYLHGLNIIHKDIKLDNVLVGPDGYLRLSDFGAATRVQRNERFRICAKDRFIGTLMFTAPELIRETMIQDNLEVDDPEMQRKLQEESVSGEHICSFPVDWFSLGTAVFEMATGKSPFDNDLPDGDKKTTAQKYLQELLDVLNLNYEVPAGMDPVTRDFVQALLARKPKDRLGANGAHEVKAHAFFKGVDWDLLVRKRYVPPEDGANSKSLRVKLQVPPSFRRLHLDDLREADTELVPDLREQRLEVL